MRDDDDHDPEPVPADAIYLHDDPAGHVLELKVKELARQQEDPARAQVMLWSAVTNVFAREARAHERRGQPGAGGPAAHARAVRREVVHVLRDFISEVARMRRTAGVRTVIEQALAQRDQPHLELVITRPVRDRLVHGHAARPGEPPQGGEQSLDNTAERMAFRLADLRESQNLTLNDLSGLLDVIGFPMSPSTLSKMENGQRRVTVEALLALAMVLEVSPNWLLFPPTADDQAHILVGETVWTSRRAWDWALADRPEGVSTGTGVAGGYDFYVADCGETGDWSLWVALQLQAWGCRVFHPRLIQLGEPWETALERAAADSDNVLVLIGPGSPRAPGWITVSDHAVASGKRVIPIITARDDLSEHAENLAAGRAGVDLTDTDRETAVSRLRSLLRLVHRPLLVADMPPFPGDPVE